MRPEFNLPSRVRKGAGKPQFWLALLSLAAAASAIQLARPINHDVAWILISSQWVLEGAEIGRDIIDVTPPLAWWVSAAAIWAGRLLGLGPAESFTALTAAYALAAIALTQRTLANAGLRLGNDRLFIFLSSALLLFGAGYDFGQREHLMLIAAVPWLAAGSCSLGGRPLPFGFALGVGAFASVGILLKPHFLVIPLATEAWLSWRTRQLRLRGEMIALGAIGCAYALAVLQWAPQYVREVLPHAIGSYGAYQSPSRAVLYHLAMAILPAVAACMLLRARGGRLGPVAEMLAVAACAAAAAAILQSKGWAYHLLPASALAGMLCVALWCSLPRTRRDAVSTLALAVALASTMRAGIADSIDRIAGPERSAEKIADKLRANAPNGTPVFAFITSPRDVHPAILASGARWVSPSCCLHLLPAAVPAGASDATKMAAATQLDATLSNVEVNQPGLILVDARENKLALGRFDYLSHLRRDPRWVRLFARYEEKPPIAGYRVFIRSRGSGSQPRSGT